MKKKGTPGPDGVQSEVLFEVREEICEPLAKMFNKSMKEGKVSQLSKDAHVTPTYKKGKKSDLGNFRPVSLTNVVGKLMESVIRDEMVNYLETHKILRDYQHGFRNARSCETNLLLYLNNITEYVDKGRPKDSVYFDLSKAFD